MDKEVLTGIDLVVKARVFKDQDGNLIELIGVTDHGVCGRYHQRGEICRDCMLNCEHYIKINGKQQKRTFTQLEVLIMQETEPQRVEQLKNLEPVQLELTLRVKND
jgi:hypothetical protein